MKSEILGPWAALKEAEMFFGKRDKVHRAVRRLTGKLDVARLQYCIVGGLALNAHKYRRVTVDIDLLMDRQSFERFTRELKDFHYQRVSGRTRRFVEQRSQVQLDILITGQFPGDGKPKPLSFPDPKRVTEKIDGQRVVNLTTLIEMKLAARRWKEFADVVELIRANHLKETFTAKLHSYVRPDFMECLEEFRREEAYDKSQDEAE